MQGMDVLWKVYRLYFSLGCRTEVVSYPVIMCRESRLTCIHLSNTGVTIASAEHGKLSINWGCDSYFQQQVSCHFPQQSVHPTHLEQNMTMKTTLNFVCWTFTQAGVRWLFRNFIRWPLFLILLRKSACRDVVGIFWPIEMLSGIVFMLKARSTDFVANCWLYPSNITLASFTVAN